MNITFDHKLHLKYFSVSTILLGWKGNVVNYYSTPHLIDRNSCNMRSVLLQQKFLFLQKKIASIYEWMNECILILIKNKKEEYSRNSKLVYLSDQKTLYGKSVRREKDTQSICPWIASPRGGGRRERFRWRCRRRGVCYYWKKEFYGGGASEDGFWGEHDAILFCFLLILPILTMTTKKTVSSVRDPSSFFWRCRLQCSIFWLNWRCLDTR